MLVTCGHAFCEGCLACMLRCAPPWQYFRQLPASKASGPLEVQRLEGITSSRSNAKHTVRTTIARLQLNGLLAWPRRPLRASGSGKRLECPKCREPCTVKGGDARTLPVVYDILGA